MIFGKNAPKFIYDPSGSNIEAILDSVSFEKDEPEMKFVPQHLAATISGNIKIKKGDQIKVDESEKIYIIYLKRFFKKKNETKIWAK